MKRVSFTLAVCLTLFSCSKEKTDDPYYNGPIVGPDEVEHEMIVLGKHLKDPYGLDNVNAALKSLYPTKAGREELKATDIYVRFLPKTLDEYNKLVSNGVHLSDYPLDYEIVRDGDWYHDPEISDDAITWQYAVVPDDFRFPSGIEYEILEECYIPDSQSISRAFDGIDWELVERKAYELSGNAAMYLDGAVTKAASAAPSGCITIEDKAFNSGRPIGVAGVRVSCNSFTKFAHAYTDKDGNYEMSRQFTGKVHYRLVFQNSIGYSIGFNKIVVPASTSTLGRNEASGVSYTITEKSDKNMFRRAAVNNSVYDYFEKASTPGTGLELPPANLRLWIIPFLNSSSTLMMQHGVLIDNSNLGTMLGDYSELVKLLLPDITLGLKDADDYASVYATTVHELAHASHFSRVGKDYWKKYMAYIVRSSVESVGTLYGEKGMTDSGYCEVGEMWAYFMQNLLYKERYQNSDRMFGLTYWFYPQILLYIAERGMSRADICMALGPDVKSGEQFKQSLKDRKPQYRSIIDQAFSRYSY